MLQLAAQAACRSQPLSSNVRPHRMLTAYRIVPEHKFVDLDLARFQLSLPATMTVRSESDGVYVDVESMRPEDPDTQPLIDRELDRVYFFTYVALRAEMVKRTMTASLQASYRIHGSLPENFGCITWNDQLTLQLKLWRLASESPDFVVRVLLHFQIIELRYPKTSDPISYPPYKVGNQAPHPRTEAKLLRNIIAHAAEAKPETLRYLEFLGLPPQLSNVSHPDWLARIKPRLSILETQARETVLGAA